MEKSSNLAQALREEKEMLEGSKDINEIAENDKNLLRDLLKAEFF